MVLIEIDGQTNEDTKERPERYPHMSAAGAHHRDPQVSWLKKKKMAPLKNEAGISFIHKEKLKLQHTKINSRCTDNLNENFCSSKYILKRGKRQGTKQKQISVTYLTKTPGSRIYQEILKIYKEKT